MFTPEYKAAWDECLRIAKRMYYVKMGDLKREELKKQLETARAKPKK